MPGGATSGNFSSIKFIYVVRSTLYFCISNGSIPAAANL
ncbi:uncharacterized protein METZ01_LOCUS270318, partial [marine metagenome]